MARKASAFLVTWREDREAPEIPGLVTHLRSDDGASPSFYGTDAFCRTEAAGRNFELLISPDPSQPSGQAPAATRIHYDAEREELLLHAGSGSAMPVYYHLDGRGRFTCASHIWLLESAGVHLEEDPDALPELFLYRTISPPRSLYRGVGILVLGKLRVRRVGGRLRMGAPEFPPTLRAPLDPPPSAEKTVSGTLEHLEASIEGLRAVRDRVIVPLSGGMDSTVLFRIAQRKFGIERSYSAGYPFESDADNREKRYATSAATALGSTHTYHAGTTCEYLEAVIRSIASAEEPIHHQQSAMFHLLFRDVVPDDRDVVVMGSGAGALFGTQKQQLALSHGRNPHLERLAATPLAGVLRWASRSTGRGRSFIKGLELCGRTRLSLDDPRNPVWSIDIYGSQSWIRERFPNAEQLWHRSRTELLAPYANDDFLVQAAVIDVFDKSAGIWSKILQGENRIVVAPFLEHATLDHVHASPWSFRLGANKHVLAEVGRRIGVPEFVLTRSKSGFGVRRPDWAAPGGVFDPLVPLAAKVVDEAELRALQCTDPERAMTFWSLLNYALWKRLCILREPVDALIDDLRSQLDR